jgi:hypothetical protein
LFGFAAMSYPCCPGKRGDEHDTTLDAAATHGNPLRFDVDPANRWWIFGGG